MRRRTLIIAAVITTASLIVAVYAVTQLFTQNTPTIPVRTPGAGVAVANCTNLAGPPYLTYTTSLQTSYLNFTCAGGYAFTVTTAGALFPSSSSLPSDVSHGYFYNYLAISNSSLSLNNCDGVPSASLGLYALGSSMILSKGSYYYCARLTLEPYSSISASSIPSFSIT